MNFPPKSSRKQTAQEWLDYLRQSNGLGGILAKTEDLAKLKTTLRLALKNLDLEHLNPKVEAGWRSGSNEELFLLVSNASIAGRLQQILPSLINELQKLGLRCRAIKVKVKPSSSPWESNQPVAKKRPTQAPGFSAIAKKSWEDLLDKLAPDSELRKTVERLLRNKPK